MKTPEYLKLAVRACRNQFNKLTGEHEAKIASFTVKSDSSESAVTELERRLVALDHNEHTRRYLVTSDGAVFVLYHGFSGWSYDIVRTSAPGSYCASSCACACESFIEAYAAMKKHWEQMEADCKQALACA